jgi:hypothetical protein
MAVIQPSRHSKAIVSIAPSSPRTTKPGRPLTVASRTSTVAKPAFLREPPSEAQDFLAASGQRAPMRLKIRNVG